MISLDALKELEPFQARSIIEELRKGSVPVEYVPVFTVGRQKWLSYIEDDLENYIAQGGAKVRFISGDYGDGKTHFMSVVRLLAMEKGFAVSFVVLTRDVPIHKFETVYQSIVRQLQGNFNGMGIRNLLTAWLDSLSPEFQGAKAEAATEKCTALAEELREIPDMDINFANALAAIVSNRFAPMEEGENEETRKADREILMHWFDGGKVTKRELKPFQVYEYLTKTNARQLMNSLILFLRRFGHQGLILLMDEMETVVAMGASVRNAAYENVRLFIDNSETAQYLHIFFSIIPDVLVSEKGFKSYDALWSRVRSIGTSMGDAKRLNYRGVLVDIHQTPLQTEELVDLGRCLLSLHGIAYRWSPQELVTDKVIEDICINQKKMGVISEVRLFIKQLIGVLDLAEQGQSPEEMDMARQMVETRKEMEAEKMKQMEPIWDS
ncbi:BREX system ATP-binding domain-containing protein [Desulfobacter sp.]|uniref:BREX system ATP-binding domain-containing protein n=1 Tax=Desulfobacter sp. TaxID=2294 RepID=UPI000E940987|nr:BREX system ATP-binding domain-containing protein [Desulfobacter sp.]HBT90174.1 ATPase [Desulfobacter sp.]